MCRWRRQSAVGPVKKLVMQLFLCVGESRWLPVGSGVSGDAMRVYRVRTWCRDCESGRTDNRRGGGVLPLDPPCHRWVWTQHGWSDFFLKSDEPPVRDFSAILVRQFCTQRCPWFFSNARAHNFCLERTIKLAVGLASLRHCAEKYR